MGDSPGPPHVPEFDLADRMRKALREAHITSAEMAQYLGVAPNTISYWINGRVTPGTATLRVWALRCGVDYEWLVGEDRPRTERGGSRSSRLIPPSRKVRVLHGIAAPVAAATAAFLSAGGLPGT